MSAKVQYKSPLNLCFIRRSFVDAESLSHYFWMARLHIILRPIDTCIILMNAVSPLHHQLSQLEICANKRTQTAPSLCQPCHERDKEQYCLLQELQQSKHVIYKRGNRGEENALQ